MSDNTLTGTPPDIDIGTRRISYIAVCLLLLAASISAWIGSPALAIFQVIGTSQLAWVWGISSAVAALALLISWRLRFRLARLVDQLNEALASYDERAWLLTCLLLGISLRLAWVLAFPSEPISDSATYIGLARRLLAGQTYEAGGTLAYWPPGYPLFITPWLAIFQKNQVAIPLSNLFLFGIGLLGVRTLALAMGGAAAARLAVLLFAVWPNHVIYSSVPGKELVLTALMPWIIWFAVRGESALRSGFGWQVACGILLGAATLVQPALQLFPAVLAIYWLIATQRLWCSAMRICVVLIGMAAVIAPWTIRNYQVFGQFVLVSTNGGFGLYGANNPRANGGYYEYWDDEPVSRLGELQADREARRLAFLWARTQPLDFLALAAKKNMRFMGDDSSGAYNSLKRGRTDLPSWLYPAVKAFSNGWWLAFWTLVLASTLVLLRRPIRTQLSVVLLAMTFSYSFLMHSIVESSGKYHMLQFGILCVLLPMLAQAVRQRLTQSSEAAGQAN